MTSVFVAPLDSMVIGHLVNYWNTVAFDSKDSRQYNTWRIERLAGGRFTAALTPINPNLAELLEFEIPSTVKLELDAMIKAGGKPLPSINATHHGPYSAMRRGDAMKAPGSAISDMSVELRAIPARVGTPTPERAYAFKCKPCGDNGYWCQHVNRMYMTLRDHGSWSRTLAMVYPQPMYLAVPLFDCMFHRIKLSKQTLASWDGTDDIRLLVDPCHHLVAESYRSMLDKDAAADMILKLFDLVEGTSEGREAFERVNKFRRGGTIPCIGTRHSYGTNRQLQSWVWKELTATARPLDVERMHMREKALAFCLMTYNMCFTCWLNAETALSLLDD